MGTRPVRYMRTLAPFALGHARVDAHAVVRDVLGEFGGRAQAGEVLCAVDFERPAITFGEDWDGATASDAVQRVECSVPKEVVTVFPHGEVRKDEHKLRCSLVIDTGGRRKQSARDELSASAAF